MPRGNPYPSPAKTAADASRLLGLHAETISEATGIPLATLVNARVLGCGFNGCASRLPGVPPFRAIVKLTIEPNEVAAVAHVRALGGHPNLPRYHAAFMLSRKVGFVWTEEVHVPRRPRELGVDDIPFMRAMTALKETFWVRRFPKRWADPDLILAAQEDAFFRATRGTALADLWGLASWLYDEGILIRDVDWKIENLGLHPERGAVVLHDLGAVVDAEVLEAVPRVAA